MQEEKRFKCINCGEKVQNLYKKYSSTVLKLTECEHCKQIADKYVEYDIVIIIIDLILLRIMAYRHILNNTKFEHFWKLSIILIILSTYSEWRMLPQLKHEPKSDDKPNLMEINLLVEDPKFYRLGIGEICKNIGFTLVTYILTQIFQYIKKRELISFETVWKTVTISSGGIFLILPSLIWDTSLQETHIHVVVLYITLSQLIAYTAICNCPKIWSLIVIFSAYCCRAIIENVIIKCNH